MLEDKNNKEIINNGTINVFGAIRKPFSNIREPEECPYI